MSLVLIKLAEGQYAQYGLTDREWHIQYGQEEGADTQTDGEAESVLTIQNTDDPPHEEHDQHSLVDFMGEGGVGYSHVKCEGNDDDNSIQHLQQTQDIS